MDNAIDIAEDVYSRMNTPYNDACHLDEADGDKALIAAAVNVAVRAEREACTKILTDMANAADDTYCAPLYEAADRIRTRSDTPKQRDSELRGKE